MYTTNVESLQKHELRSLGSKSNMPSKKKPTCEEETSKTYLEPKIGFWTLTPKNQENNTKVILRQRNGND